VLQSTDNSVAIVKRQICAKRRARYGAIAYATKA
jgi:hypothetical protein